jgi:hypothetical protein
LGRSVLLHLRVLLALGFAHGYNPSMLHWVLAVFFRAFIMLLYLSIALCGRLLVMRFMRDGWLKRLLLRRIS